MRARPRPRRRISVAGALAATAVLISGCASVPDIGRSDRTTPIGPNASVVSSAKSAAQQLVPTFGAYLGMYYGSGAEAETDSRIGAVPKIHLTYYNWSDDWAAAPATRVDFDVGKIPLVNWEPFDADFADIIHGRYDDMLAHRADDASRLVRPFFLDFAAEMNEEEGWGGHDPAKYIAAWRHIHDLFTAHHANNVVWVWCPNNSDSANSPSALSYYPGPSYVDWTGIDGYNWGTSQPGFAWQSFRDVFAPAYSNLAALGKPIIIGETASDEEGGSKSGWIGSIAPTLRDDFPAIKGVVWFDVNKERRWQIQSTTTSLDAFRNLAANPYFTR